MKTHLQKWIALLMLVAFLENTSAVEFEKLGNAVAKALGTKKAFQKVVAVDGQKTTVFYSKNPAGKAKELAVVRKGIYPPNCSHTWVVGVNPESAKVSEVRVVEMSCPHAFPTKKAGFLDQYKGKGPKDLKKLKYDVHTIAKATGSSDLTTDAVKASIEAALKLRGKI